MSPNTLRAWERRFGFPKARRSPGKHRLFTYGEIAALRDALQDGLSISSAVSRAREGLASDATALVGALSAFEGDRADLAIEAALAMRSVERTVEEVVLPTLTAIHRRHGSHSAAWAFAAHWSADWLRRAIRLAPAPVREVSIVIGDATRDELDPDNARVRALQLLCVRAGIDVLSLSARGFAGVGDAVAAHDPDLVVIAGSYLRDDAVARWAYAVRLGTGTAPFALYQRVHGRRTAANATDERQLPSDPLAARERILDLARGRSRRSDTEHVAVAFRRRASGM